MTEIKGDMIFLNWVEQLNFMTDNDIHILSSTGVKTIVTTGENTAFNDMSFTELGYHFDLIIVGGSIYDGNFIHQKNILLDDDLIGAVSGFSTTGAALDERRRKPALEPGRNHQRRRRGSLRGVAEPLYRGSWQLQERQMATVG